MYTSLEIHYKEHSFMTKYTVRTTIAKFIIHRCNDFCIVHTCTDLLVKIKLSFSVVVCYGIGHVGSCSIAQQQFALLLLLLDELKKSSSPAPPRCWVYDPILDEQERAAIERSGCALFTTNDVRTP